MLNTCLCGKYHPPETNFCEHCGSHVPATRQERREFERGMFQRDIQSAVNGLSRLDVQLELRQCVGPNKAGQLLDAERRQLLTGSGDRYVEIQRS